MASPGDNLETGKYVLLGSQLLFGWVGGGHVLRGGREGGEGRV